MNARATRLTAPMPRRRVQLGGGRWASIRSVDPADALGLSDFYLALSPESLRRRFLGATHPVTAGLISTFVERSEAGLIATLNEPGPHDGAVIAHATILSNGRGGAEVAFAVADDMQRFGVGRALMTDAVCLARQRGLREVSASLFADNTLMRRLLAGAGCRVRSDTIDAGVEEISLDLRAAGGGVVANSSRWLLSPPPRGRRSPLPR